MTLFQISGLEGLTHITLGMQSVLTSISLHVSTVTPFAFVGIQRTPLQRSVSFAPLLHCIYKEVAKTADLGELSAGLRTLFSVTAE